MYQLLFAVFYGICKVCSKCVRCRSCGATTPGHEKDAVWMCDFSLCYRCGLLMEKGVETFFALFPVKISLQSESNRCFLCICNSTFDVAAIFLVLQIQISPGSVLRLLLFLMHE